MPGKENKSGKLGQKFGGSKSVKFETETKTDDLALAQTAFLVPNEIREVTEEQIQNAIVYENGATSIDFMLPEDEREILEQNLNQYSDMEKMKKALSIAKQNKMLHEDVQTLNQISKADQLINGIFDIMNDPNNLEMINRYIRQKLESGQDVAKAYKEIGLMNKAMMDAREGMINRLKAGKTGKNAKIAFKFTNGDGEETQIGVEL